MTTTLVKRPARTEPPMTTTEALSIAPPPNRGQSISPLAGAAMMMMPLMAGTGSLTVAVTQRGNPILVVGAFLTLLASIAIGAVMLISQRSGTKRQVREGRERYLDYIEALREHVRRSIAEQRAEQSWRFPEPALLLGIATDNTRRWERRRSHQDFLTLRFGTGDVPLSAGLTLEADTGPLNDFDPVCLNAAQELQQRYAVLHAQPITASLAGVSQLSILGDVEVRRRLAVALVLQLATWHSPNDLSIAVVRSNQAAAHWDWVKWLPHVQDPTTLDGEVPVRRVTATVAELRALLEEEFENRLNQHQRSRGSRAMATEPLVIILDGEGLGPERLAPPDPHASLADLGIHVINLLDSQRQEPESVDARMSVNAEGIARADWHDGDFRADLPAPGLEVTIARTLSPLRLTLDQVDADELNDTVGLPEILGVSDPARIDLRRTWRPRALRDLLRVPIGVGQNGGTVMLDLKESAHGGMGPHGMVVGATGSGKSEMLRTLVSALVIGHGPDRLALMLVDFKGGATFAPMEGIPHIAGMITNLQDDLTLVDRMRDALYGEMQRRQEILKQAGNLPNVTAYQDLIDAGQDLPPLPHLLVIIDEFSELLTAKPDFADLFVAVGRIGRSIGVHLLLATQKLEMGKIRGLESHLSYRIALRTFSEGESRDAIGVPDAYHLPPEPGSGYLKVDTSVFERFKAALVSAPYVPPDTSPRATAVPVVPFVAVNGLGAWVASQTADQEAAQATPAHGPSGDASVLDVLCREIVKTQAERVRPVWLEPLPRRLALGELAPHTDVGEPGTVAAMLGRMDDPSRQRQFPLVWDFTGGGSNLLLLGSPATGKSTLLATMVSSLALRYAPGDVSIYVIDYGGGLLHGLQDLPHVATVAGRTDPELVQRAINDVMTALAEREATFREHGFTSMDQWRTARRQGSLPDDVPGDIFLIVDGWGSFRDEQDGLEDVIGDIAARGQNFGVHVVLTITQGLQVRMRMQAAFGGQIVLRLNDVYDSPFDRTLMRQLPKDVPGRGIAESGGEFIFQAALPRITPASDGEETSAGFPGIIAAARERWGDRSVSKVRVLPDLVRERDLPTPNHGDQVALVGLSDLNLGPAGVDLFGTSPHLFIFGDGQTGKTNTLKVLARQLMAMRTPEEIGFVVVDYRRTLLEVIPADYELAYVTNPDDAAGVTNEITSALRQRIPGKDVTAQQLRERSWWKGLDVVVLIDDFELVATSVGNPLQGFASLIPQARDLGFHTVLARRTGGAARALYDPLVQSMTDLGTPGLMFSGDRSEGRILNNVAPTALPPGRALYVAPGGYTSQLQVALAEDSDEP